MKKNLDGVWNWFLIDSVYRVVNSAQVFGVYSSLWYIGDFLLRRYGKSPIIMRKEK